MMIGDESSDFWMLNFKCQDISIESCFKVSLTSSSGTRNVLLLNSQMSNIRGWTFNYVHIYPLNIIISIKQSFVHDIVVRLYHCLAEQHFNCRPYSIEQWYLPDGCSEPGCWSHERYILTYHFLSVMIFYPSKPFSSIFCLCEL